VARKTKIFDDMSLRAKVDRAIKAKETVRLNDGGGLVFITTAAGKCRALHRYEYQGIWKTRWFPGEYPRQLSLAQARVMLASDKAILEQQRDPADIVAGDELVPTLKEYTLKHYSLLAPPAQRSIEPCKSEWFLDITRRTGKLGDMEIDKIKFTDVENALRKYWDGHRPRPSARRICGNLARVLRHRHAMLSPDDPVWGNPANYRLLRDRLGDFRHYERNHPSLAFEFIPAYFVELAKDEATSARLIEWIILTGTRCQEAAGARWGEIDWKARTWTIPTSRLKTEKSKGPLGKPFVVPLSLMMVRVLRRVAINRVCDLGPDDLIFPAPGLGRNGFKAHPYKSQSVCDAVQRINPDIVTHGFRATVVAWGTAIPHRKRPEFSLLVMDRVLGHHISPKDRKDADPTQRLSQAMGHYAHHAGRDIYLAQRKVVMREWSAYIRDGMSPPAPPSVELTPDSANVVVLRRAA
jgi:integrase